MTDEYAIDAVRVRDALIEERAMQLPGGLYHLNQLAMAYNSNRIEGSQLSQDQTRYLYETQTIDGPARVDDVIETTNHFRMFDLMLDSVGTPLTVERVRRYHEILKAGTSDAAKEWFVVGGWKRVPNTAGGLPTTSPDLVAAAMDDLVSRYSSTTMTFDDIADFHHRFEAIHPFQDGNGRVGRIVMFEQCLANGIMPFIVLDDEKAFYYRGLSEYETLPGFLRDTFRHFQDLYWTTYSQYLPPRGTGND